MKTGASPNVHRAHNSRRSGDSYDENIWKEIVSTLMLRHDISEYNLNRIIVWSFPSWGKRWAMASAGRNVREKALSRAAGDTKWVYCVSSAFILDSLMGQKRFMSTMDRAIRSLKPRLGELDGMWAARKEDGGFDSYACGAASDVGMLEIEPNDPADTDNLLYGIYDDHEETR